MSSMTTRSEPWSSRAACRAQNSSCCSATHRAERSKRQSTTLRPIDDVQLGSLTGLLARIKPAIAATTFSGQRSSKNAAYVEAVARTNVKLGVEKIRQHSSILADLEKKGSIQIVAAVYDLTTGVAQFVSEKTT